MHPPTYFPTIHPAPLQTSTAAIESGRSLGSCILRKVLPMNVPKCHREKVYDVWFKKFSNSSEFYYLEPGLYAFITDIVEAMNTLTQETHKHSESCITVKVSRRTQKKTRFTLEIKDLVLHSLVRI